MRSGSFLFAALLTSVTLAADYELNGHRFTLPSGFRIEQVAGPPLVDRPVSADFDERGRLYVTDSSGSNEAVEVQREKRPHRIVRLEDSNGDGKYDQRTIYADKLMFPEGCLWYDGSLYVAAPPEIWKFTDANDDGIAEHREVWFDGKTLTHCANDLHGPYLGPDGWIYWCKGAFASQTYDRPGKPEFKTRAAHIFRRRPEGGLIEPVMTGGMDNPVEVVFTPGGERIFSTTFLTHPDRGHRDGLIHAVYGGVYGKSNAALENHPRTGELMPVLDHLGAAAPCGLVRLKSEGLGKSFHNNVLTTLFNLHKVTRHVLTKTGATFASETSDLLISDNLDFHPTDVLEDADGSLIVVDTGGWFHLCCPTSQLEKPDILGGIYRIRKDMPAAIADPRGTQIAWNSLHDSQLVSLLNDERFAVREQACQLIAKRGTQAIPILAQTLSAAPQARHRLQSVWALTRIDEDLARTAVQTALADSDETVRQAALHSISVWRDRSAAKKLAQMIAEGPAHNRRGAAEALGRVGTSDDVQRLLAAVQSAVLSDERPESGADRVLEHSLMYAAMEIGDPRAVREMLRTPNVHVKRAALIVLDQMAEDALRTSDIQPLLSSEKPLLSSAAWWVAEQHPTWGNAVAHVLAAHIERPNLSTTALERLEHRLQRFSYSSNVRKLMARVLQNEDTPENVRLTVLRAMANSRQTPLPKIWAAPLRRQLAGSDVVVKASLAAFAALKTGSLNEDANEQLHRLANDDHRDAETRLRALNLNQSRQIAPHLFDFVVSQLDLEARVAARALAVEFLVDARLDQKQLQKVARKLPRTTVMELRPLLQIFEGCNHEPVGIALVESLLEAPAATSLFPEDLKNLASGFGPAVERKLSALLDRIEHENQSKFARIEAILALLPRADVRRGMQVFQSSKSSCIACHQRGYLGGNIGPELNGIGKIRSERDLLESILFPNLSFVRSYEPIVVLTNGGKIHRGLLREETKQSLTLQIDAQKTVQIPIASIDERRLGSVSIMPAGLEKQLSKQDLADLVLYLKHDM